MVQNLELLHLNLTEESLLRSSVEETYDKTPKPLNRSYTYSLHRSCCFG